LIDALIAGRVYGKPLARTSKNSNAYATAKVHTPMANGEASFVNVIAFSDTARSALLALQDGDSVAIAGELKVSIYQAADGTAKPSLDVTAYVVTTEYHVSRKRKALQAAPAHQAAEFPEDERWLSQGGAS
jgi:single-stranded DNA-binding protein